MDFKEVLHAHDALRARREKSLSELTRIEEELAKQTYLREKGEEVTIFTAGSLGRLDCGQLSDWDVFVVSRTPKKDASYLNEIELLACMVQVNRALTLPEFSNDGKYLKVHYLDELQRTIGQPEDDSANCFTTRMLMALESKCQWKSDIYEQSLKETIRKYFRDASDRDTFRLLFLLNDLLRYWRTLCLNYETIRNEKWPWRKRNINLKFSRRLTVFSTVLAIVTKHVSSEESLFELTKKTPLERLASTLDFMGDESLLDPFKKMLDDYEQFLGWKDMPNVETLLQDEPHKSERLQSSARFAEFFYKALMHERVAKDYRRFLVV